MLAEKLGAKIRLLRQAKNYTQENMADLLEMSVSGYAKIERGETDINLSRIEQIAKIFGIPANEIININPSYAFYNHGTTNGTTFQGNIHMSCEKRLDGVEKKVVRLQSSVDRLAKKENPT